MVKNILKGIQNISPLSQRLQGQQDQLNRARQDALSNLAGQQRPNIGGQLGGQAIDGAVGGLLDPGVWSQEMLNKYQENAVMSQMAAGLGAESAVPPPQTCPLSKAIIIDALLDLMELQPDMHMGEILRQVMSDSRNRTYDVELAKTVTELVDSLRHACKNDSFSETPRPDSTERRNPQSIGLVGGVPPSHLPYAPPHAFQPVSSPDSEQPDLFLPLG